tara:strand:- start:32 stop:274 length:243 start_codon:yes stop_codon:yes gene_type:complete
MQSRRAAETIYERLENMFIDNPLYKETTVAEQLESWVCHPINLKPFLSYRLKTINNPKSFKYGNFPATKSFRKKLSICGR